MLLTMALAAACSTADPAPPVARVSLQFGRTSVAIGSPVDLKYRFDVAAGAAINGNYRVFVHVLDDRGKLMWDDDHDPPTPTSAWKPGQTVEYSRTRFIPSYPYLGEATVVAGLYKDSERLPLEGPDPADRESESRAYQVGKVQILAQVENLTPWRKGGWHPLEFSPQNTAIEWEWTEKFAMLSFKNPKKDITFYLEYDARPDLFSGKPQTVNLLIGGRSVFSFPADQREVTLLRIPITADQLGTAEMVEMTVQVEPTFVPAQLPGGGADKRELGIRVYHTFVEVR